VKRLRVGVVGSGIGSSHIEAYQALPDMYEVTALCDIDPERGKTTAAKYGVQNYIPDLAALFAQDLDLIDICTPSSMHFEQACAALKAGFDIVVEKPVARSLAECDELERLAAQTGKIICPIFQYRFGHGFQKLRHLQAKGLTGKPLLATAETHWFRGDEYYGRAAWRGTWDGETGGCFTTHAIHINDMLCEMFGAVKSVHARTSRLVNDNETEDLGLLSLEFHSGAMATSSVTLGSRQEMSRLRFCFRDLVAESGISAYNPGHEPWTFPHDNPASATRIHQALADFAPLPERFAGQFHRLYMALTNGGTLPVTLADARRSIELLTAIYYSAHTGQSTELPLKPGHPFYNGWLTTMKVSAHG
jgi:predicted dehydrogenase